MDRAALAAFVRTRVAPAAAEWEERAEPPFAAVRALLAEGFATTSCAEIAFSDRLALADELAPADSIGTAATLLHGTGAPLSMLSRLASLEAKARFLAPALAGRSVGALAFSVDTHPVTLHRHRDGFELDGTIPVALGVPGADWIAVPARLHDGRTVLAVVASDAEGVSVSRIDTVGLRAAALGEVRFRGCAVQPWQVMGGAVDGALFQALADERLLLAGIASAVAGSCLKHTLAFVGSRAFAPGQTLGDQPVVRHRLADISAEHQIAAAFHREVAGERLHGPVAADRAASVALVCAEALRRVAESCMQLLGARGFMDEHPVARAYRDAVTLPLVPALDPDALLRDVGSTLFASDEPSSRSADGSAIPADAQRSIHRPAAHPLPVVAAMLACADVDDSAAEPVDPVGSEWTSSNAPAGADSRRTVVVDGSAGVSAYGRLDDVEPAGTLVGAVEEREG